MSKPNNPPPIKQGKSIDNNAISKIYTVKSGGVDETSGYVKPNEIVVRYDANQPKATTTSTKSVEEDYIIMLDDGNAIPVSDSKPLAAAAAGLSALYNKDKSQAQPVHPPTGVFERKNTSSFGNIETKPTSSNCPRIIKREPVKRRPQPNKKTNNPANVSQAKVFFEKAGIELSKEDMLKVQKLLVTMKGFGDVKDGQQYLLAARTLISVLVNSHIDNNRIKLINTLIPLIPVKYRYQIQKVAAEMAFNNSQLYRQCSCEGASISVEEVTTVKNFVVPMMYSHGASHELSAFSDRALLQESQPILAILVKHRIVLQHFFDLLPERQLRRVRALAIELKTGQAVAKAKERSANFKGEKRVNPALFQPSQLKTPSSTVSLKDAETAEDAESQKLMSQALSQAQSVNRQKQRNVIDFQEQNATKPKTFNPYRRSALKDSTKRNLPSSMAKGSSHVAASKRVRQGATKSSASRGITDDPLEGMDLVDRCLQQVNSSGFVQQKTRVELVNSKINANVPKGMQCIICNMPLKEVGSMWGLLYLSFVTEIFLTTVVFVHFTNKLP